MGKIQTGFCTAKKIAKAVVAAGGTSLEPDKTYVYGLLHDIGRHCGYTYILNNCCILHHSTRVSIKLF